MEVYYVCDHCAHTWLTEKGMVSVCEYCREPQFRWHYFHNLDDAEDYSDEVMERTATATERLARIAERIRASKGGVFG